jgi:ADP-heptose:LPS heptosyltransferase
LASPRHIHILVFRFSALGDVAMTVPVLKNLLLQHPGLQITFVSIPFVQPLFEGIERLHFYPADIKGEYNGVKGLYTLSHRIKKEIPYDAIADLHNVIRTKLLRFFLAGKKVAVIDKGRKEKEELTRPVNKKLRQLRTTFQRYADVFEKLGFPVALKGEMGIVHRIADVQLLPGRSKDGFLAGIAPFAKHAAKMYPLDKMKEVVRSLSAFPSAKIILFGSRAEAEVLEQWEKEFPNVYSYAGKFSFADELTVISQLDVMISMDSANMHLASLYGVPVVSVWGGTHPFLGFYGWDQPAENAVQTDMPCRPSSVFGNKDCPVHGKNGCMEGITPGIISSKALIYSY